MTINTWQPLTCYHGHIFGVENSCETALEVVVKKKKKSLGFRVAAARPIKYSFYPSNIVFLSKKVLRL